MDGLSTETLRAWALVAVSLFNTVLLLWLGLTLWLHADRHDPGVILADAGFLLGSIFFISHSALLLSNSWEVTRSNTLWLAVAMLPILILPYVWYVVLLNNAGYWTAGNQDLRRRHRAWLMLLSAILILGFGCLVLLGIPFIPVLSHLTPFIWPLRQMIKIPVFGVPLVAITYPLYVMLCVAVSVDTLQRQVAQAGPAGNASFRRSRAQLAAATLVLLLVSVLVAVAVVWTITNTREGDYYVLRTDDVAVLAAFDFTIALLIAVVTVLLGQAITRHELFTGKALPRRGLARHWVHALALAAGYGALLGGALVLGLEPVYAVLLTAVLMTVFFVLLSWHSSLEWQKAMRQLRPIVTSEGWYERLTAPGPTNDPVQNQDAFRVLCEKVLVAPIAFLIPSGPLASFVSPRAYPPGSPLPRERWTPDTAAVEQLARPISPEAYLGASWALALWSERGMTGTLLLGTRADGSLYSEEELEIARATGERLIDTAASLALSEKLMALQREQMVQTQLLDQRTRRVLHDEVLPLIHTAMLAVADVDHKEAATERLSDAHREISALLRELPMTTTPDVARLGPLAALRKAVEGEFGQAFESVTWAIDDEAERAAAALPPMKAETLYFAGRELMRNAARHARPVRDEGCRLKVAAGLEDGWVCLAVEDNGSGWNARTGQGHGLELHTALLAIAGGSLSIETTGGGGTRGAAMLPSPKSQLPPGDNRTKGDRTV